jgi:hypothetical protein
LFFDNCVADLLKRETSTPEQAIKRLDLLAKTATAGLKITYIEVLNEVNLAQVFQWF